jgi:hypothetical protein
MGSKRNYPKNRKPVRRYPEYAVKDSIYGIYHGIKKRCYGKWHQAYHNYGARGIEMDEEWRKNYMKFYEHVEPRPSMDHSLDRIDNNKGYIPGNVRWATTKEQARNTRFNVRLEYHGKIQTQVEWSEELGISRDTFHKRLKTWGPNDPRTFKKGKYRCRTKKS